MEILDNNVTGGSDCHFSTVKTMYLSPVRDAIAQLGELLSQNVAWKRFVPLHHAPMDCLVPDENRGVLSSQGNFANQTMAPTGSRSVASNIDRFHDSWQGIAENCDLDVTNYRGSRNDVDPNGKPDLQTAALSQVVSFAFDHCECELNDMMESVLHEADVVTDSSSSSSDDISVYDSLLDLLAGHRAGSVDKVGTSAKSGVFPHQNELSDSPANTDGAFLDNCSLQVGNKYSKPSDFIDHPDTCSNMSVAIKMLVVANVVGVVYLLLLSQAA
jgi:hypothetical protein